MFFRRPGSRVTPTEGDKFQRRVAYDLVETAYIKAVTIGSQGTKHITFRISTPGIDDRSDHCILSADVFSEMYHPS